MTTPVSSNLEKKFPDANTIDGASTQIQDALRKSVNNNNVTILTLPPKGSANDVEVKLWNQVILTKEMQKKARDAKIPYETEWFIVSRINMENGAPVSYNLTGSMGGGWAGLDWNLPGVIDYIV